MQEALTGRAFIQRFAAQASTAPGVYRMIDARGEVLYVGKAKNLKNRISSYAQSGAASARILRMVAQTTAMETITTRSEAEALLLEANLIKKYKPRYNILLKDDKSYPYLLITDSDPFPRIVKFRGAQKKGESYFGPFASVAVLDETLATLQKAFLLRPCADTIFKNRTRPCLQYQIKRCSAPCVGYVNEEDYGALVSQAKRFLRGKNQEVLEELSREMQRFSDAMDFESAARARDRLRALTRIRQEQSDSLHGLADCDVLACHKEGDAACVQVFFFRGGQHFGNHASFPQISAEHSESEILSAFIGQYYPSHPPPREILLSHDLSDSEPLAEALAALAGHTVTLHAPQRGERRRGVEAALANAKAALALRLSERQAQALRLKEFAEIFGLETPPLRIEVYDNSHIMGTHAVGGMIVATPEGFDKKHYRRFTIRRSELTPGDDYAMMRQVLTRRLSRLASDESTRPDFLLIDGGKGHLSVVMEVLEALGLPHLPVACIAKGADRNAGREWFHLPGSEPFQLPENSPLLHYIQRLRDEAHRYAIGSHRIKRAAALRASALDEIPGIGATRKRALLHHFGSSQGVAEADLAALRGVPGISQHVAKKIYDYFH